MAKFICKIEHPKRNLKLFVSYDFSQTDINYELFNWLCGEIQTARRDTIAQDYGTL